MPHTIEIKILLKKVNQWNFGSRLGLNDKFNFKDSISVNVKII